MQLSPNTYSRMDLLFPVHQRREVEQLLIEECGNNLPFLENLDAFQLERFRFAVLKISDGNMDALYEAISLAQRDWRDVLVAAGFGHDPRAHEHWLPEQH